MNIREMLSYEKYINDTIDIFSKAVKDSETGIQLGAFNKISITLDEARRIAKCLDWLQAIFTQNINDIEVDNVNINGVTI
jgi:hypothetical protein